ncbi:hypothetical protein RhiirA1_446750 [Rhizophagus irregularis]|uniref:Uncharacterized protein n=1 Tax=Rhizophagus irregularis TaxID=588596 RepID=A0A2N0QXF3_9GLOM|nr:hypothetical protein RhiirA1_446750 [Rhizophagus irregularis]
MKPTSKRGKSTPKKRKKLTYELVVPWVKKLEQIDSLNRSKHGELSINFREYFMSFCKRIEIEVITKISLDFPFFKLFYFLIGLCKRKFLVRENGMIFTFFWKFQKISVQLRVIEFNSV